MKLLIKKNIKDIGIIEGLTQMYIEEADKLGLDKVKGVLASKLIAGYWFSPEEISYFTELPIPQVKKLMFSLDD